LAEAQNKSKGTWSLVLFPVSKDSTALSKEDTTKLLTTYGVQSVPICLFQQEDKTAIFTGKDAPYEKTSWSIKPELIRYIPPKPIIVQKPIPQTDSGGGVVVQPKFNP
jgi:hypothetical protein